jgi:transcriptional regulator with XRE-family HTH domain
MDDAANALSQAIGARVKTERTLRRWTLDRLAEAAGVSRRMVINVEQGAANPSVATLVRISDALGIGLPSLVEPPVASSTRVTRDGEGSVLWRGVNGGRGVLLVGTQTPESVELWDWTLGVDDEHRSEAHTPGTRELLQVRAGKVSVRTGNQIHMLDTGDAIAFGGDVSHAYCNAGREEAVFLLAVFKPTLTTS